MHSNGAFLIGTFTHVVTLLMPKSIKPWQPVTWQLATWNSGNLATWQPGNLEPWQLGNLLVGNALYFVFVDPFLCSPCSPIGCDTGANLSELYFGFVEPFLLCKLRAGSDPIPYGIGAGSDPSPMGSEQGRTPVLWVGIWTW